MKIFKYPLHVTDQQIVQMPACSKIIHAGLDPTGCPCLWAKVDPDEKNNKDVIVRIVGTGHDVPPNTLHVGSFVQNPFVWHVFI